MKLEDVASKPLQYGDRVVHVDEESKYAGLFGKITEMQQSFAMVKWEFYNKPVAITLNGIKRA